jgi:hypothetical protein
VFWGVIRVARWEHPEDEWDGTFVMPSHPSICLFSQFSEDVMRSRRVGRHASPGTALGRLPSRRSIRHRGPYVGCSVAPDAAGFAVVSGDPIAR